MAGKGRANHTPKDRLANAHHRMHAARHAVADQADAATVSAYATLDSVLGRSAPGDDAQKPVADLGGEK